MRMRVENRIEAYKLMNELKEKGISQEFLLKEIVDKTKVPYGTIYGWYKYGGSPFGNRKLKYCKELFYVLGALMGDGCAYYWKKGKKYMVILVGEKEFINKYAGKLEKCTGKLVKGNIDRSKNVWNHKIWNVELYLLLKKVRDDLDYLWGLLKQEDCYNNSLQFIEGYFDAEGCVKIIKEPVRKTPKICLDICSTDYPVLEIIRKLLMEHLNIEARYSVQEPNKNWKSHNKKTAYHLRIYKKEYIRKFLNNMLTIKLKPEKVSYVENWLNNGK